MKLAKNDQIRFAPMFVHSFRLVFVRKRTNVQLMRQQYHDYNELQDVPDRLRWCRLHLGLTQAEVAEKLGVSRICYTEMELGNTDCYNPEILNNLARLYHVPLEDLLDDYNRFLCTGQGKNIKAYRESLSLNTNEFADLLHIEPSRIRTWEDETYRISKPCWEKYFKGKI